MNEYDEYDDEEGVHENAPAEPELAEGEWHFVTSSCITALMWSNNVLLILMRSGRMLSYQAPYQALVDMFNSPSKGAYLGVIKGRYAFLG